MKNGDTGFEVEWCKEIPKDEHGDADLDQAKMVIKDFPTHELAMKYAKEVHPQNQFLDTRITPWEVRPVADYPELLDCHYGESEFYRGEQL